MQLLAKALLTSFLGATTFAATAAGVDWRAKGDRARDVIKMNAPYASQWATMPEHCAPRQRVCNVPMLQGMRDDYNAATHYLAARSLADEKGIALFGAIFGAICVLPLAVNKGSVPALRA